MMGPRGGLAPALAVLALAALIDAQTCGTKGGGTVRVSTSRGAPNDGDTHSCKDCGSSPCIQSSTGTCYSCCSDGGGNTINLFPYTCGSQCSNSPCPSSSRRRTPPPPPSSSWRRSPPPPPSPSGGGNTFGDFDFIAVEVPRGLTVPLGLFGIVAGAVMGTHGCDHIC